MITNRLTHSQTGLTQNIGISCKKGAFHTVGGLVSHYNHHFHDLILENKKIVIFSGCGNLQMELLMFHLWIATSVEKHN